MRTSRRLPTILAALAVLLAPVAVALMGKVVEPDTRPRQLPTRLVDAPSAGPNDLVAHSQLGESAPVGDRERADIVLDRLNQRIAKRQTTGSDQLMTPLATPSQRGCTTKLLPRNFSSRNGARPSMAVLHYTVSRNVEGWSDVNAIWGWFSQERAQASSNYIIDFEGHCLLAVAETAKAWTQGAFNPWSISIEFIANGSESTEAWKAAPGLAKGARVFADVLKRWGIPLRFVNPVGCVVTAGITDHNRLECDNNHTDVEPNFPYGRFMDLVQWYYGPRYKFELRDGGEVLARSKQTLAGTAEKRTLRAFLDERESVLLDRVRAGDHDVLLDRVKVCC